MSKPRSNTHHTGHNQDGLANKLSESINRAMTEGRLLSLDASKETDFAALVVERAAQPRAPAWMANAQTKDPSARAQVRASYERCLEIYRTVVRPQDTAFDDAGGAVAFFVAVNLNALHDVHTTTETLLLLERQLLGLVRDSSVWGAASISERQFYFEQMAMLGVLVAGTVAKARAEGPAAVAKTRETARKYLLRVLGMDPDLLTFGEHGLAMQTAPAEPPSAA
jgi:hypothetical protein